jgi:hypothetical protein
MGVTYDTGALIAAERGERRMWALHAGFLSESVAPTVPSVVLAQAWRGGAHQANLARMLAPCRIDGLDEAAARAAGTLLAATGSADVVDAAVVHGALDRGDVVITDDPEDLVALAGGHGLVTERP